MHPRSRHWHIIDHVITRRRDIRDILITRVMRGADCWTDHILLRGRAVFRLARKHRRQASGVRKKLDAKKLKEPRVQQVLKDALTDSLPQVPQADDDIEAAWSSFRATVYTSAKSILVDLRKKKTHQDRFDENNKEIMDLLAEKRIAHVAWLNDSNWAAKHERFKKLRSEAQCKIRPMKDTWWAVKAEKLQGYADQNFTKQFFSVLKVVYGPPSSAMTPIRARDGTLLTEKTQILEC
ncbi:hypothetical protein ACOMHN_050735 [Nucella lapillus]